MSEKTEAPINLFGFEAIARERIQQEIWHYIADGGGDELTMRRNRTALDEVTVNPRFMIDIGNRDLSTTVLGDSISFPVMVAPAGGQRHVHPDGELATARAAGAAGTVTTVSMSAGYSFEEVAEVATGPLWMQLYHFADEITELLVRRGETAGYRAVCLTVDVPVPTPTDRHAQSGFTPPIELRFGSLRDYPELRRQYGLGGRLADRPPETTGLIGPTWKRLEWLRSLTSMALVLKGIRTVADARLAVEHGVDGIVVSNHGGRQIDGTLSSIETLGPIADAVGDKTEVYFDSGVRRGTDVLRALALGARAALIGRPVHWGLAFDGEAGVSRVLEILRTELDRAMAHCGKRSVAEIDRSTVNVPAAWDSYAT